MKTDIGLPDTITTLDGAYIAGVYDGERAERKRITGILEEQAKIARKPDRGGVYKERVMVEHWNRSIDHLVNELRRAINEHS